MGDADGWAADHGRPLRVFRQMKTYNDPTMNPYLYKVREKQVA